MVCEGSTEKDYVLHLHNHFRIPIRLETKAGATPKTLVEWAKDLKVEAKHLAKSDPFENFEDVWCVFDIDEHPKIPDAKQQARDNEISLAISNPSFELWILLHFREQTAHIDRKSALRACKEFLPNYDKHPPCDDLIPKYPDALSRAEALAKRQRENGKEGENPSTDVFKLVEKLKLFRPKP